MVSETRPIEDVPPAGPMTEEEFVAWCGEDTRAEWIDGEVVMMSPVSPSHSDLDVWLTSVLQVFVEAHDLGRVLRDVQVRLAAQRRRRTPDISFVRRERQEIVQGGHIEGPPDLVIEIVSPDSEARDWREKYLEYEAAGVQEYWVIDPASRHVEAYVLVPAEGTSRYRRTEEHDGWLRAAVLLGFRFRVEWLWEATRPTVLDALRAIGVLS